MFLLFVSLICSPCLSRIIVPKFTDLEFCIECSWIIFICHTGVTPPSWRQKIWRQTETVMAVTLMTSCDINVIFKNLFMFWMMIIIIIIKLNVSSIYLIIVKISHYCYCHLTLTVHGLVMQHWEVKLSHLLNWKFTWVHQRTVKFHIFTDSWKQRSLNEVTCSTFRHKYHNSCLPIVFPLIIPI